MKILASVAAVFFYALCASAFAQENPNPGDYIVSRDTPAWFKSSFLDFPEDVAEAAEEGRRVMIYFGQDGCPYCRKLHEESFKDAETMLMLTMHFDSVAVNIFGDVETVWTDGEDLSEKDLAAQLGIQFTPSLLFLDEEGKEIVRVAGYQPPRRLRAVLDYASQRLDRQGVALEDHLRALSRREAASAAPLPKSFAAPDGALHSPGGRAVVFVSQGECEICGEWRDYLEEQSGAWGEKFKLIALDRFGKRPAADGESESEWAEKMKVSFVPALIFLDENGAEFFRVDGYLRAFHLDSVLEYAAAGATDAEPEFQRFLQNRADKIREEGGEVVIW